MPEAERPFRLSENAFEELKEITKSELGESMTNQEIEEMGGMLLKFFSILSLPKSLETPRLLPNEREAAALRFLEGESRQGRSPSVRELAKAAVLRSSRSGFRLLKSLVIKGWVYRDPNGKLRVLGKP